MPDLGRTARNSRAGADVKGQVNVQRRLVRLVATVLVALTVTGCGHGEPGAFRARPALRSCGVVDRRPNAVGADAANAVASDCFAAARMAVAAAEIELVFSTTEGAPIRHWLRTFSDGTVEQFEHVSGDQFGAASWTVVRCAAITIDRAGNPTPTGCSTTKSLS
jgi:hypothetical protein